MKNTPMHNNFDPVKLSQYFIDNYDCWYCGENNWDCFHHIVGRGSGDSTVESSILNAAPLHNHKCHLPYHGRLTTDKNKSRLLAKTMQYLLDVDYEFTQKDIDFYHKYKHLYDAADSRNGNTKSDS